MATSSGHTCSIAKDFMEEMFENSSSLKHLILLKPIKALMFLNWILTKFLFLCQSEIQDDMVSIVGHCFNKGHASKLQRRIASVV
jgi:hypothetical protein